MLAVMLAVILAVILSVAKNLTVPPAILRYAQNDRPTSSFKLDRVLRVFVITKIREDR